MDHTHLSAEQYARVIPRLMRERDYLCKLVERMRANRFPVDDPLFAAVVKAWEAASYAFVASATAMCRNRVHGAPPPRFPSVMGRRPWSGAKHRLTH